MLQCLQNQSQMSVLERQQARQKWQQNTHTPPLSYFGDAQFNISPLQLSQELQYQNLIGSDSAIRDFVIKADPGWTEYPLAGTVNGFGNNTNNSLSRTTSSCLPMAVEGEKVKENSKKRKSQDNSKISDEVKDKRTRGGGDSEDESKITEQNNSNGSSNNNNKENSGDSKASGAQKQDYIHVRARRGQATDSHSLAERVRREKISERMKYLQDLVPGCNKITGKAGMLDEIINYVQSLQRQVEFLSMKLAAVNPRLDFNIENMFAKEMLAASTAGFPIGTSPEMANFLPFNSLQQMVSSCGLDMVLNSPDMAALQRTRSAPVSEGFLETSCFSQAQPSSSAWDNDLQNLYNADFNQGRSTFQPQSFTGILEANNLKMEM
ncbi:hypothetical protein ACHQM5_015503 [Ranunculus cassubicifolius]